jgi:hypothetical protein
MIQPGAKFGRWTVLHRAERNQWGYPYQGHYYRCRCDCGKEKNVMARTMLKGQSTSCGCSMNLHGMSKTSLYITWRNLKSNKGTIFHPPWSNNFEVFFADVGERPSPDHRFERIDKGGGFIPGNVAWVKR